MYAVIVSGGKQHRVIEGEVLKLELIEAATGETINFDKVLMVGQGADVKIGAPYVASGKVTAEVLAHGRADKVTIANSRATDSGSPKSKSQVSAPKLPFLGNQGSIIGRNSQN